MKLFFIIFVLFYAQILFAEQQTSRELPDALAPTNLPITASNFSKIKLVLLIVVDQLGAIHIENFGSYLSGGIQKLLDKGVVFTEARHRHAITETCPGHATISTGSPPSIHGIVSNEWVERDSGLKKYCVEDEEFGFSPRSLRVSGLADWIKNNFPQSQTIAISGKDRAAILLGSHTGHALWYDKNTGNFRSSKYYSRELPIDNNIIVDEVNRERAKLVPYGTMWELHEKTRKISKKTTIVSSLKIGSGQRKFPYLLGDISANEDSSLWSSIYHSPYLDALTAKAAGTLLKTAKLGTRSHPDFLAVSFSSLDIVGHEFGPTSLEALDTLVRVSELIDELLQNAINQVGYDNLLIVLTSDHGALPLPESYNNQSFKRVTADEIACIQKTARLFQTEHKSIHLRPNFVIVAKDTYSNLAELRAELAEKLKKCSSLHAVWSSDELVNKGKLAPSSKLYAEWQAMFSRSFYEPRSPDIFFQFHSGTLVMPTPFGTGHGTPYDYDTKVPIIFYGGNLSSQQINTPVGTEQIAPTVAKLLGLRSVAWSDEIK